MGLVLVSLSKDLGRDNTTAEETRTIYEEVVRFQWGASDKSTGVQDLPQPRCAKGWRFYTTWGCRAHLHSTRFSEHGSVCYMQPFVQRHGSHVSQVSEISTHVPWGMFVKTTELTG